jgi:hypothetical protein
MNRQPTTLERAFEIARAGECRHLTEVIRQLKREGYSDARRHLDGAAIQRQLRDLMAAAGVDPTAPDSAQAK